MNFIVRVLKAASVVALAILILAPLALFVPDIGIAAAVAVGALGLITLKWPMPIIWINNKGTSSLVVIAAVVALIVSALALDEHRRALEAELRAKNEARLVELRASNPSGYLAELKATNDARWEREFESLDKVGYEKFVGDRRAKIELERKNRIAKLLEEMKSVASVDIEGQARIYRQLSDLEPNSRDFRSKRESLEKQISQKIEAQARLELQQKNPTLFVTLENFSWSKEGFGNVMIANFSIKNTLPWPIKDIEIQCTHSAPSGTTIDQNTRTIYERIEANKVRRISNFNMGFIHSQASRSGCNIVGVVAIR